MESRPLRNDQSAVSLVQPAESRIRGVAMTDPLSQLLGAIRLTGGIFLEARFTAPWCTTSQVTPQDVEAFLGTPGHIIAYHVVITDDGGRRRRGRAPAA